MATEKPFDAATLVVTAAHVHALAQGSAEVLAWDHNVGEVRAMTRDEALGADFVAFTNRGWLNDWSRDAGCWNGDHTDVTPEHAKVCAEALNEWLRRIA